MFSFALGTETLIVETFLLFYPSSFYYFEAITVFISLLKCMFLSFLLFLYLWIKVFHVPVMGTCRFCTRNHNPLKFRERHLIWTPQPHMILTNIPPYEECRLITAILNLDIPFFVCRPLSRKYLFPFFYFE